MKEEIKCFQCGCAIEGHVISLTDRYSINVYHLCSKDCQEDFIEEQGKYDMSDGTSIIFKSL